uniref:Uncharacterized protein n=1 Tax=Salix viminalis TaxID=40686 RepID=A0A6N2N6B9_SALVM
MAGREIRNRRGKEGRDKVIDDEDITFHRMVAKMQEVAGERGGYLHGRGALDSDDLLYLKEQMEAEEDAERLLRHSSPASVPLSLRVEPKPKSGIRQQDLLKKVVEVKPKRLKASNSSDGKYSTLISSDRASDDKTKFEVNQEKKENILPAPSKPEGKTNVEHSVKNEVKENPVKSLLGLAYASSDEEED